MSQDKMLSFDPQPMVPKDVYKLLIGAGVPRPIAFVSTLDLNNVRNLAPFSFLPWPVPTRRWWSSALQSPAPGAP
jgi:flavin reductase (DIM6/NTAB) family NADH-FMN oxidoreductase RutF